MQTFLFFSDLTFMRDVISVPWTNVQWKAAQYLLLSAVTLETKRAWTLARLPEGYIKKKKKKKCFKGIVA